MTARERLQLAYEYAFCPWRLNSRWRVWLAAPSAADADELKALDDAARLYLPLPQRPVSSKRALYRLALFQAGGCECRMRTFIANVRAALARPAVTDTEVPVGLVRDVSLPRFSRSGKQRVRGQKPPVDNIFKNPRKICPRRAYNTSEES